MAEYTITIKDIEGGISVGLASDGQTGSLAGITALALVMKAKQAAKAAKETQAACPCPKCQAARGAVEIPPGTTIH